MKTKPEQINSHWSDQLLPLSAVMAALPDAEAVKAFLLDLCTPAELQAMVDRWTVVQLLQRGLSYRAINEKTGISVTTVGRVARFLEMGNGGYQAALEALETVNSGSNRESADTDDTMKASAS